MLGIYTTNGYNGAIKFSIDYFHCKNVCLPQWEKIKRDKKTQSTLIKQKMAN